MNWTDEQKAIFDEVDKGRSHVIVRARAGTGKTSTIIEALNYANERDILLAAFNKSIADELRKRVSNPAVMVKTLHALGFGMIRRQWKVEVDDENERGNSLVTRVYGQTIPDKLRPLARQLHTKVREVLPFAHTIEEVEQLASHFDLLPDEEWESSKWTLERLAQGTLDILQAAMEQTDLIDFADMIFLPLVNNWATPIASLVLVDEAQDMSAPQLMLADRARRDRGRLVLVGDDRQAIYGFRGADTGSLDRIKGELDSKELGLKTTFRCPKRVVEEAQQFVPDYYVADTAPEGVVRTQSVEKLSKEVQPGAFILSRTNAPLVGTCLDLIREGTAATVRGRDIGKGLLKLIQQHYDRDLDSFLDNLAIWASKEYKRANRMAAGGSHHKQMITDKHACLQAVADRCETTDQVREKLGAMFSDDAPWRTVVCSTVHRAKGLESSQVWILLDTFKWEGEEEDNLRYVAITRSKHELIYATKEVPHAESRDGDRSSGRDDERSGVAVDPPAPVIALGDDADWAVRAGGDDVGAVATVDLPRRTCAGGDPAPPVAIVAQTPTGENLLPSGGPVSAGDGRA